MNYSLDKHLKNLIEDNRHYKNLYSSWDQDRQALTSALKAVTSNFPHYSQHDDSHCEVIIKNIEMLLGEKRIRSLSATDTWLLLEAAYVHDLGMVIPYERIEKEFKNGEFKSYLQGICNAKFDKYDFDLCEAANYILKVKDNLDEIGLKFNAYDSLPKRFELLLGEIALIHGKDFEEVLKLEYETNGYGTDIAHPRFVASMIRLGDILDLDDGRFNTIYEKVIGNYPNLSKLHKDKHAAITHLLIKPQIIEVSANSLSPDVYRQANAWVDWLKDEIKNLSSQWSQIVPEDFDGPPTVGKMKLSLSAEYDESQKTGLKFSISQEDAFNILEGSSIYDDNLVFIRELYNNALDATKIKMWLDIKNGNYDEMYKTRKNSEPLSKQKLEFPFQIPKEVWKSYPINFEVKLDKENKKVIFSIEDRGYGISKKDLQRIANVGQSWKGRKETKELIEEMPYFLQVTGDFGLGLQSVFLVSNEMKIYSKVEGEPLKEIYFETRKQNGYITVKNIENKKQIEEENLPKKGTKIIIELDKNIFDSIRSEDIIRNFSYNFLDDDDDKLNFIIDKINNRINEILKGRTEFFSISINGISRGNEGLIEDFNGSEFEKIKKMDEDTWYYIEQPDKKKDKEKDEFEFIIHLWEKVSQSYAKIMFKDKIHQGHRIKFCYKGVSIDIGNLRNQRSNSIVGMYLYGSWTSFQGKANEFLNMARNEIKNDKIQDLSEIFNRTIAPKCLRALLNEIKNDNNNDLFKKIENSRKLVPFRFACKYYGVDDEILESLGNEIDVNADVWKVDSEKNKCEKSILNIKEFFEQETFLYYKSNCYNTIEDSNEKMFNICNKIKEHEEDVKYIIDYQSEVCAYLTNNYSISTIWNINCSQDVSKNEYIFLIKKGTDFCKKVKLVEDGKIGFEKDYYRYANNKVVNYCRFEKLAINKTFKMGYRVSPCMVSPFVTKTQMYYEEIIKDLECFVKNRGITEENINQLMKESEFTSLLDKTHKELVTPKLVEYVIRNSLDKNNIPSKDEVKADYRKFLENFWKYKLYRIVLNDDNDNDNESFSIGLL